MTNTDRDSKEIRTLFISDEAYNELVTQMRMSGFAKRIDTAKGLCDYVEFLVTCCNMQDNRPEDIRAQDAIMLENGVAPEWRLYTPRLKRHIKLSAHVLIEAAAHCLRLGIAYTPQQNISGAPVYTEFVQCTSALMEAIGTEWVKVTLHDV